MTQGRLPCVWHIGCSLLFLSLLPSCTPGRIPPSSTPTTATPYVEYGTASWYGDAFHGRPTASGEVYDMFDLTAAHVSAPLGIHAIVTNLDNGRAIYVRINDRGPFVDDRILDLSYAAARHLQMVKAGLAHVRIEFLPETMPTPAFMVQAGAYTDHNNARRVQRILATQYPQVWIAAAYEGSTTFYRVRLGTFSNRADAERTALQLVAMGYAASVMPLLQSINTTTRIGNSF